MKSTRAEMGLGHEPQRGCPRYPVFPEDLRQSMLLSHKTLLDMLSRGCQKRPPISRAMALMATALILLLPHSGRAADLNLGKAKAAQCEGCHGKNGVSTDPTIPSLAGQHKIYTSRELRAFKTTTRVNATMNQIAGGLTEREISALASYYQTLKPMTNHGGSSSAVQDGDGFSLSQGKVSYAFCQGCHGPRGSGNEANPRIAGQHAAYLIQQLEAYKEGARKSPIMSGIASALTDDEIQNLAEYMAGLK